LWQQGRQWTPPFMLARAIPWRCAICLPIGLGLTLSDRLPLSKSSHTLSGAFTKMSMTTSWILDLGLVWGVALILPLTMLASMPLTPARMNGFAYSTPVLSTVVEAFCTSTTVEAKNSSPPM
jgi:hypothetical protein